MPATTTGLFMEHPPGKGTQKEILKEMERIQAKTEKMKIALNGPQKASVRKER